MRIKESKLRRIIRRVLSESQVDDKMAQLVVLENEWWDWCSGGNADTYAMGEMATIEDQINDLKSQMGLPIHDQEYGWAYGDGSPPVHPTELRKHMMNEASRRIIREFGESDAEVIRQSQNRERMIGIGMDMGTIGFDPNWDYSANRPLRPKKMHRLKPPLQMVADMIRGGGIGDNLELMPGRNGGPPDMFYFTMVGSGIRARVDYQSYNVQKNYPDFTGDGCFISTQNPEAVKGAFEEGAETTDPADIERVLENFIDFAENNIQEDSVWMTFAPAS